MFLKSAQLTAIRISEINPFEGLAIGCMAMNICIHEQETAEIEIDHQV